MKTVIVDIRGKYAAALFDDGCVIKVRNHNYAIGQEIEMRKQTAAKPRKLITWAASAAAVLLLCGVSGYAYYSPYSYVSLDVNPSIEFTLNRFDRVLSVKGVNDDGEAILTEIKLDDLSNKSIGNAISLTVQQISEAGYFNGDEKGGIVIATSAKDPDKASELAEELGQTVTDELQSQGEEATIEVTSETGDQTAGSDTETVQTQDGTVQDSDQTAVEDADEAEQDDNGVVVEVVSVGEARVAEARELGVTPGRLHLVEKLQQSAANPADINIEEWLQKPVKDIMKATKENKKAQREQALRDQQQTAASTGTDVQDSDDQALSEDNNQTNDSEEAKDHDLGQGQNQGKDKKNGTDNAKSNGSVKNENQVLTGDSQEEQDEDRDEDQDIQSEEKSQNDSEYKDHQENGNSSGKQNGQSGKGSSSYSGGKDD